MSIESLDGTTNIARGEVKADLDRPQNYNFKGGKPLLAETSFRFNLPGGESIVTNATAEGKANVTTVMDKLEALCGKMHVQQASNVLMMTSQSGLSVLRGGLDCHGIESNEHSSVDFTISKNETTGDITIRYSSPKELPFSFEWTATIKPDGYVTTTPFRFTSAETKAATKEACTQLVDGQKDIPEDRKAEYAQAIGDVLVNSSDAADTLAVLRDGKVMQSILLDFKNQLRPAEDVARRIAAVRDNVAELREATGGNQAKFKSALDGLVEFGGKAMPKGVITSLVKAAQDMDVSALKKLYRSSKPLDIHKAVRAFRNGLEKIYADTGAITKTYGNDFGAPEVNNFRTLVSRLVLAGLDENAKNNIHAAVNSKNGQLMKFAYMEVTDNQCEWPEDYDLDKKDSIGSVAFQFSMVQDAISDLTLDTQNADDGRSLRMGGVRIPARDELDVDVTNLVNTARDDAEAEYMKTVNQQ